MNIHNKIIDDFKLYGQDSTYEREQLLKKRDTLRKIIKETNTEKVPLPWENINEYDYKLTNIEKYQEDVDTIHIFERCNSFAPFKKLCDYLIYERYGVGRANTFRQNLKENNKNCDINKLDESINWRQGYREAIFARKKAAKYLINIKNETINYMRKDNLNEYIISEFSIYLLNLKKVSDSLELCENNLNALKDKKDGVAILDLINKKHTLEEDLFKELKNVLSFITKNLKNAFLERYY